jgi:peptidoglycan/LPS O-acetylase OafA/YrhL
MKHMHQLDGLRALAVIAVLIRHFLVTGSSSIGYAGVLLFFVLSGYLITGILLNIQSKDFSVGKSLKLFYARRFLRIFPLFYFVLAVLYCLNAPTVRAAIGWQLSYLSNFYLSNLGAWKGPATLHFWSLAVEEQFYLCWPLVVLLIPRARLQKVIFGMIVMSFAMRLLITFGLHAQEPAINSLPFLCLDSLGMGALLAVAPDKKEKICRIGRWAACFAAILLAMETIGVGYKLDKSFLVVSLALAFAWIVVRASEGAWPFLATKPLAYLGAISYGLYVYHLPVHWLLKSHISNNYLLALTATILTIGLSSLSWHLMEKPINGLKRYFEYEDVKNKKAFELEPLSAFGFALKTSPLEDADELLKNAPAAYRDAKTKAKGFLPF